MLVFRATLAAYGSSQARGPNRAVVAGLSNTRSKPHLWPTAQLEAIPDPWPAEQGQGSHPILMGTRLLLNPQRHNGNSLFIYFMLLLLHIRKLSNAQKRCSFVSRLLAGFVMQPPSTVFWNRSWRTRWMPVPTRWTKPTHASQRWGANGKCPFHRFFWCYTYSLIL